MSDNFWADGVDEVEETNAMRVLREKAEADSKVIREMAERLAKMEAKEQRSALEDSLKAKGLDPKVADLIPAGTDPEKFLADYGTLLARKAEATDEVVEDGEDDAEGSAIPADEAAARAAVAKAASGAQPKAGLDATEAKIKDFDNAEDLLAFLATQ